MTQLKILGASRVKALQEMADSKMKEEIREVERRKPTNDEITAHIMEQAGVLDEYLELRKMKERTKELAETLKVHTGRTAELHIKTYNSNSQVLDIRAEYLKAYDDEIAEIKSKWARVKQELWLCETLEQAKELVGYKIEGGA